MAGGLNAERREGQRLFPGDKNWIRLFQARDYLIHNFKASAMFFGGVAHLHYYELLNKFAEHKLKSKYFEELNSKRLFRFMVKEVG